MSNDTDGYHAELDFGSVAVPSCSSVNLIVRSEKPLRIEQLLIPGDIAGDFLITDIKVGKDSQFIGAGCLPAAVFSTDAVPEILSGYNLLGPNQPVVLSVTNQATEEKIFRAVLLCSTCEEPIWPRRNLLGWGSTLVVAGGSAHIHSQVVVPFHPERLIVPTSIGESFDVVSLITGSRVSGGGERVDHVKEISFAETSPGHVEFNNVVGTNDWITLIVKNVSNKAANFQGALAGYADHRRCANRQMSQ